MSLTTLYVNPVTFSILKFDWFVSILVETFDEHISIWIHFQWDKNRQGTKSKIIKILSVLPSKPVLSEEIEDIKLTNRYTILNYQDISFELF